MWLNNASLPGRPLRTKPQKNRITTSVCQRPGCGCLVFVGMNSNPSKYCCPECSTADRMRQKAEATAEVCYG